MCDEVVYYRWQYICSSFQLGHRKYISVNLTFPIGPFSYFKERAKPLLLAPSHFSFLLSHLNFEITIEGGV
jgi:hypothetical protein